MNLVAPSEEPLEGAACFYSAVARICDDVCHIFISPD